MLKKTLPTIILLYALFIVFFLVYMKMYFEAKKEANNTKHSYVTVCGKYNEGEVKFGIKIIHVYIADDECKKDLGLSGAKSLKEDEGMMFVFDKIGNYSFWMKDMNFPIDILWLDDKFKVVGQEKNVSPDTYPKVFGEKYPALYILETSEGFLDKYKIKIGNKLFFSIK